jgi:hypothetical protein
MLSRKVMIDNLNNTLIAGEKHSCNILFRTDANFNLALVIDITHDME